MLFGAGAALIVVWLWISSRSTRCPRCRVDMKGYTPPEKAAMKVAGKVIAAMVTGSMPGGWRPAFWRCERCNHQEPWFDASSRGGAFGSMGVILIAVGFYMHVLGG
jgi:hypothetical protein